jgi:hypothetical protein
MTTQIIQSAGSLKDALYALALAKPAPDAEVLDNLVRRYPEHADMLTDMAVALALDVIADSTSDPIPPEVSGRSTAVANAMSRFHNRLYIVKASEQTAKAKTAAVATNPFASFDRAGLRDFGSRLGANTVFAMKLRDRVIEPETMTEGFRKHIADTARAPLDVLFAHFARPAEVPAYTHYKAEQKPASGAKQSFEEAVRTSGLTPEQQAFLLGL